MAALLKWLLSLLETNEVTIDHTMPQKQPQPAPSQPEPTKFFWDTPVHVRHSCRVVMDEFGLAWAEKDELCKVIQVESGFNNAAACRNRNKLGRIVSTDWGVVQINDYYHIGKGKDFPSVDYVLQHPEEAVRFMVRMYKAGQLKLWVAYSSGAYKKVSGLV